MSRSTRAPVKTGCGGGVIGLGGLLALGPGDGLNGAERPVEPGLLGSLHLVEGQAQVVLQVLVKEEQINDVSLSAVCTALVFLVLLICQQYCFKHQTFLGKLFSSTTNRGLAALCHKEFSLVWPSSCC